MKIVDLGVQSEAVRRQAATLLVEGFDHPQGWPDMESAIREVARVKREGLAFTAMEGDLLLGWIGGLLEYNGRVWELHPIAVRRDWRPRGIGRALAAAFEEEACRRGAPDAHARYRRRRRADIALHCESTQRAPSHR